MVVAAKSFSRMLKCAVAKAHFDRLPGGGPPPSVFLNAFRGGGARIIDFSFAKSEAC